MLYARDASQALITAMPYGHAKCPQCLSQVRAKCGQINIWHWAHHERDDCDRWSEPESAWHKAWKEGLTPGVSCEVTKGRHRADIVTASGTVLELQHSQISVEEMREREEFYGKMVWLLDGFTWRKNFYFWKRDWRTGVEYDLKTFRWKHAHKTWLHAKKPVFVDFGDDIFQILSFRKTSEWVQNTFGSSLKKKTMGTGLFRNRDAFNAAIVLPSSP